MRASATAILLAGLLASVAGCRETHHCEPGNSFHNGECLPFADVGPHDAGLDASMDDASNDAGHDGGPCDHCGDGSVCSTSGDAGLDAGAVMCVQCVDDSQCAGLALPDGGVDGGAPGGAWICESFACVLGCRRDTQCGGNACRTDHRCSAYPVYPAVDAQCRPCDTDGNCSNAPAFFCVEFTYQNGGFSHPGAYCLQQAASCGTSTAPLDVPVTGITASIDGTAITGTVCGPATSCEALRDTAALRPCMGGTVDCGLVGTADGVCSSADHCTIRCASADDCPTTASRCMGTTPMCVP